MSLLILEEYDNMLLINSLVCVCVCVCVCDIAS